MEKARPCELTKPFSLQTVFSQVDSVEESPGKLRRELSGSSGQLRNLKSFGELKFKHFQIAIGIGVGIYRYPSRKPNTELLAQGRSILLISSMFFVRTIYTLYALYNIKKGKGREGRKEGFTIGVFRPTIVLITRWVLEHTTDIGGGIEEEKIIASITDCSPQSDTELRGKWVQEKAKVEPTNLLDPKLPTYRFSKS